MILLKNGFKCAVFGLLILLWSSCSTDAGKKSNYKDTEHYALNSPKVINLPDLLNEISGVAYYPRDTSVFAIVDEMGVLFKIPLNNPQGFKFWEFGKTRDYEDLVYKDSTFYILVSKGDIVTVTFAGDSMSTTKYDFPIEGKNEFESMYLTPDSGKVVIVCKECEEDKKSGISSYTFKVTDSGGLYTPHIVFDLSDLKESRGEHLKAAAATVNPLTNEIYIISAIQNLLLIASPDGKIKEMIDIDPKLYKQPEGITFTPEGDMVIASEFADVGFGQLLLFKNKKKRK